MLYLQLEQNPVPASRPRVTRWGVYYGKKYTEYRKGAGIAIASAVKEAQAEGFLPINSALMIAQLFEAERPRTTKLDFPSWDVDNANKALWEALQEHGVIKDDKNILASIEMKRWTLTQPQTHILIRTLSSSDMSHALSVKARTLLDDMMMGMATALAVDITNKSTE